MEKQELSVAANQAAAMEKRLAALGVCTSDPNRVQDSGKAVFSLLLPPKHLGEAGGFSA